MEMRVIHARKERRNRVVMGGRGLSAVPNTQPLSRYDHVSEQHVTRLRTNFPEVSSVLSCEKQKKMPFSWNMRVAFLATAAVASYMRYMHMRVLSTLRICRVLSVDANVRRQEKRDHLHNGLPHSTVNAAIPRLARPKLQRVLTTSVVFNSKLLLSPTRRLYGSLMKSLTSSPCVPKWMLTLSLHTPQENVKDKDSAQF